MDRTSVRRVSAAVLLIVLLFSVLAAPPAQAANPTASPDATTDSVVQIELLENFAILTPGRRLPFMLLGTGYDSFVFSLDAAPPSLLPVEGSGTLDGRPFQLYSLDTSSWTDGLHVLRMAVMAGATEVATQKYVLYADRTATTPLDTFDVAIVLIGFEDDPAALFASLPRTPTSSTRLTPDATISQRVEMRYDYAIDVASAEYYRQFLEAAALAGEHRTDLEGRLDLDALAEQRSTGVRQDIFDPLDGYEIPSTWLEAYLSDHPPAAGLDQTDFVYYLVNLAPLDEDTGSDHWYSRGNPDPDTGRDQDWWRLEWDNDLNTPMAFPLNIFGGPNRRVFIDPTAYQWYVDWFWIWFEGRPGRSPFSLEYEEVEPARKTSYLATILADLAFGLTSTLPSRPPLEPQVLVENLVLVGSATETPESLSWIVHGQDLENYLIDFMTLKTWEVETTIATTDDYTLLRDFVDSVTTWSDGFGAIDGIAVWDYLFEHRLEFVPEDPSRFEILSVSFVYDDRAMVFAGDQFTGLGGSGISAIFLQTNRLFDSDGLPQKGLTHVISHEVGHSLGYSHQFGFTRRSDFVDGSMGYFHDGLSYGMFWEDALWRTYVHAKLHAIRTLLAEREPMDLIASFREFYAHYQALDWSTAYQNLLAIEVLLIEPPVLPEIAFLDAVNGNGFGLPFDGATVSTGVTFSFGAGDSAAAASFSCTLDGVADQCTSPWSYVALDPGAHAFEVVALNDDGEAGPPATFAWTVLTPAEATLRLQDSVEALNLPRQQTRDLLRPLHRAYNLLTNSDANDEDKTCRQFEKFRGIVDRYVRKSRLTVDQGSALLTATMEVQVAIGYPASCPPPRSDD